MNEASALPAQHICYCNTPPWLRVPSFVTTRDGITCSSLREVPALNTVYSPHAADRSRDPTNSTIDHCSRPETTVPSACRRPGTPNSSKRMADAGTSHTWLRVGLTLCKADSFPGDERLPSRRSSGVTGGRDWSEVAGILPIRLKHRSTSTTPRRPRHGSTHLSGEHCVKLPAIGPTHTLNRVA